MLKRQLGVIIPQLLLFVINLEVSAAALDATTKAQVELLAKYLQPSPMYLDGLLAAQGFKPPKELGWNRWSTDYKLRYAWASFEEGKAGNGKALLAHVAEGVAERSEAALQQTELRELFGKAEQLTLNELARPPPTLPGLPSELQDPVRKLARYLEHSPYGSLEHVLKVKLELPESVANSIIDNSKNYTEVLEKGMASISDPAVREEKLTSLTREVAKQSESIHYEPSLAKFFPTAKPESDSGLRPPDPSVPGSGGGGGGAPPKATTRPIVPASNPARATADYTRYYNRHYSTPAGRSFVRMAVSARGFGGVIFGNRIGASTNVPSIKKIAFESLGTNDDGVIVVTFTTGTQARMAGVSKEAAVAAYQMIYDPPTGLPPPAFTNGIGMVGIRDNVPFAELSDSNRVIEGSQYNVVLHPALQNLDLGWAFLMVDVTPIEGGILEPAVVEARGTNAAATLRALWGSLDRDDSQGTWKVVDVPMTVTWSDTNRTWLEVRRTSNKADDYPLGLRKSAFIEMWPILENDEWMSSTTNLLALLRNSASLQDRPDQDFANRFYRLLPLLTASSIDYYKVNQFARVLAIVRWAKHQGAEFVSVSLPKLDRNVATPESIRLSENGVKAVASITNLAAAMSSARDEMDALLQRLLREHKEAREYDTLIERQNAAVRRLWAADSGSPDEVKAEHELEQIRKELDQLLEAKSGSVIEAYRKLKLYRKNVDTRLKWGRLTEHEEIEP
jgi:hypothetical protein